MALIMKNVVFRVVIFCLLPAAAGFLISLYFYPDYGGDMFLQNIRNYMALQHTRPSSSWNIFLCKADNT
jgi:hypothetical protein